MQKYSIFVGFILVLANGFSFLMNWYMIAQEGGMNVENSMNYEELEHIVIVYFHGEMNCMNAPIYRQELIALLDESDKDVVFNFKDTSFIDSSGIGLVLGRYNQLKFDHRTLILTGLNHVAYRLFELTGLFQIMPYYESIDELKEGTL